MHRERPFEPQVADDLLSRPGAPLRSAIPEYPHEAFGDEPLRMLREQEESRDGQQRLGREATCLQQALGGRMLERRRVGMEHCLVDRIDRCTGDCPAFIASMASVVKQLLALAEAKAPVLVSDPEEDFVANVGMDGLAWLNRRA